MTIRVIPLESFNQTKYKAVRMFELKPGGWLEEIPMEVDIRGYAEPKLVETYSQHDYGRLIKRSTYKPLGDLFVEIEQ